MLDCPDLAVPVEIMHHVVHVESARNPFAIGVVGGRLSRQPRSLDEALAAVQTLKEQGYNFSVGIAQVNRYNLARYGLSSYAQAFETCSNLRAGSQILKECHDRARDWGKAFSCYYSGNFVTGFEHGYVQKVFDSMQRAAPSGVRVADITVIPRTDRSVRRPAREDGVPLREPGLKPAEGPTSMDAVPTQVVGAPGDPYTVRVVPSQKPSGIPATANHSQAADRIRGSRLRGGAAPQPDSALPTRMPIPSLSRTSPNGNGDNGAETGSVGTSDRSFVF